MNIIKKVAYASSAIAGVLPMIARAQFEVPSGTNLPEGSITEIITNGMNWLLIIVGILGVIGFVIAGILYLTAAGDESRIEKGKQTMIASITGIIVALIGVIIIQAVEKMLNGSSTNF